MTTALAPFRTSTFNGDSAEVVEAIFALHFPSAACAIDMTYGKGRFWKWPSGLPDDLHIEKIDLEPVLDGVRRIDARTTPFPNGLFDVAVIDPPFMNGLPKESQSTRQHYESTVGMNGDYARLPLQADVFALYAALIAEAARIADAIIVKCKDTIERSRYIDNRSRVASALQQHFVLLDVAVLVPSQTLPIDPKWKKQQHFRRQESYFLIGKKS